MYCQELQAPACRMFQEGFRRGYDKGYEKGYADGFAADYVEYRGHNIAV